MWRRIHLHCGCDGEWGEGGFFSGHQHGPKILSEKTMNSLHCNHKSIVTMYKVVKSTVEPIVGVVHYTPLRVRSWFGNWDLMVVPLDDHMFLLGQEFLIFSKGFPLPHIGFLVFLDKAKIPSMHMMTKRKIRWIPRMYVINLTKGVRGSAKKNCDMVQQ